MINKRSIKLLLASILTIVFVLTIFTSSISSGEEDSYSKTKEKLTGISEDERGVLQNLFLLVQEIEEMEREENKISKEIYLVKEEIKTMEVMIVGEETAYEKKRDVLKQVLNSYQRKGAGSFLEIILDSDNLTDFLRRVNTLRDLTGDTGELLEQLKESKEKLSIEKEKLSSTGAVLHSLSPLATIDRGYSIVQKNGEVINSIKNLRFKDNLDIVLKDGNIECSIEKIRNKEV